ncbi:hypothetical protein VTI74DRAFT_409 [Chaetomium olivicolor]
MDQANESLPLLTPEQISDPNTQITVGRIPVRLWQVAHLYNIKYDLPGLPEREGTSSQDVRMLHPALRDQAAPSSDPPADTAAALPSAVNVAHNPPVTPYPDSTQEPSGITRARIIARPISALPSAIPARLRVLSRPGPALEVGAQRFDSLTALSRMSVRQLPHFAAYDNIEGINQQDLFRDIAELIHEPWPEDSDFVEEEGSSMAVEPTMPTAAAAAVSPAAGKSLWGPPLSPPPSEPLPPLPLQSYQLNTAPMDNCPTLGMRPNTRSPLCHMTESPETVNCVQEADDEGLAYSITTFAPRQHPGRAQTRQQLPTRQAGKEEADCARSGSTTSISNTAQPLLITNSCTSLRAAQMPINKEDVTQPPAVIAALQISQIENNNCSELGRTTKRTASHEILGTQQSQTRDVPLFAGLATANKLRIAPSFDRLAITPSAGLTKSSPRNLKVDDDSEMEQTPPSMTDTAPQQRLGPGPKFREESLASGRVANNAAAAAPFPGLTKPSQATDLDNRTEKIGSDIEADSRLPNAADALQMVYGVQERAREVSIMRRPGVRNRPAGSPPLGTAERDLEKLTNCKPGAG